MLFPVRRARPLQWAWVTATGRWAKLTQSVVEGVLPLRQRMVYLEVGQDRLAQPLPLQALELALSQYIISRHRDAAWPTNGDSCGACSRLPLKVAVQIAWPAFADALNPSRGKQFPQRLVARCARDNTRAHPAED